jgi:hypothetical protein
MYVYLSTQGDPEMVRGYSWGSRNDEEVLRGIQELKGINISMVDIMSGGSRVSELTSM